MSRARVSEAPGARSPEGLHLARSPFYPRVRCPQEVTVPADSPTTRATVVLSLCAIIRTTRTVGVTIPTWFPWQPRHAVPAKSRCPEGPF